MTATVGPKGAEVEKPGREAAEAFRDGVALVARVAAERLDLTGRDRARFLHNLTTANVSAVAPGSSTRGFVTSPQGRVLSDFDLLALDERIVLRLPPGRTEAIVEHLSKYRVMEQVELEPAPGAVLLELRGARSPELLEKLGVEPPVAPGGHRAVELAGRPALLRRRPRGREPRFEFWVDGDAKELLGAVHAAGKGLGLVEPDGAALEAARIEDGELLWGIDYGDDAFPQETGEEDAISWSKGCYLGQEVVARIRYRGGVQRSPRGLRFLEGPPEPGCALLFDGREAGRATSVAVSSRFGPIGLGLVHRRVGAAPARLELETGGAVELAPLPFA